MKKAEFILVLLAVIAAVLNVMLVPGSGLLTVLFFMQLACLYLILGFVLFLSIRLRKIFKRDSYRESNALRLIGAFLAGLAFSQTIMGIMFRLLNWVGGDVLLRSGLMMLLVVIILGLIKYAQTKSAFYVRVLKRAVVYGILGLIMYLIPDLSWMEFKYRNNANVVAAIQAAKNEPHNQEKWEQIAVEISRLNRYE